MSRTLFDVDDAPDARKDGSTSSRPRREAIVPVRLTKAGRDQLAEVARHLGISLSTYMRQVVLARPLPPRRAVRPIPEVNRDKEQLKALIRDAAKERAHDERVRAAAAGEGSSGEGQHRPHRPCQRR